MFKKDAQRIKKIFSDKQTALLKATNDLAMELNYQIIDQEIFTREVEEIDRMSTMLFGLENEILNKGE